MIVARPLVGVAALAVALQLALTGCTSKGTESPAATGTTSATTSAVPTSLPTVSTTPLPPQASFSGTPAGAAADLLWEKEKCPTDKGMQTIKGQVKNSAAEKRDYSIMIIWLKNNSGTPLGAGRVVVKGVEPGATADWSVTADVADKADTCVPNVFAGAITE